MELKKHIIDEKTGISYTLCGDYYLPDLALPEEKYYELGRFGVPSRFMRNIVCRLRLNEVSQH